MIVRLLIALALLAPAAATAAAPKPPPWVNTPGELQIWKMMNTGSGQPKTPPWKSGRPLYITEKDAYDLLEETYDHAFCTGVPRLGHRGSFPDEEFLFFDCTTRSDGVTCVDGRYRSLKTQPYGYFRLALVRRGSCY